MNISIIGSGNMAHGIGTRMVTVKQSVTIYDRNHEKAQNLAHTLGASVQSAKLEGTNITGDMIIFALPYAATLEVIKANAKTLAGKIVIDISNPVNFETFDLLTPSDSSAAEEIAKLLPEGTNVVKAFNTTFAKALVDGTTNGKTTTVQIAGDDAQAKEILENIIVESGLAVEDVGPLTHAQTLEKTAQKNIRNMYGPK